MPSPSSPRSLGDPFASADEALGRRSGDPFASADEALGTPSTTTGDPFASAEAVVAPVASDSAGGVAGDITEAQTRVAAAEARLGRGLGEEVKRGVGDRIVDALRSINYGQTRFIDTLAQTGDLHKALDAAAEETVGSIIGAKGAQRMGYGELLKKYNVAADGSLSDIVPWLYNESGKGWQMQKGGLADVTAQSALGTVMDIGLDPATYMSLGARGVAFGVGAIAGTPAKKLLLSKRGVGVAKRLVERERPAALRLAQQMARETDLDKVSAEVLAASRQVDLLADATARSRAADEILRLAQRDPGLLHTPGVYVGSKLIARYEPLRQRAAALGGRIASMPVARQFLEAVEPVVKAGVKVRDTTDRLTAAVLRGAAKIPGYVALRDEQRALDRAGRSAVRHAISTWAKGWGDAKFEKAPTWRGRALKVAEYVTLHLDNPARYSAHVLPAAAQDALPKIRRHLDEIFATEAKLGWVSAGAHRTNYAPRFYKNGQDDLAELSRTYSPVRAQKFGTGITKSGEERVFNTLDDAMDFAEGLKKSGRIKWNLDPELDIRAVLERRLNAHAKAFSMDVLERRAKALYSVTRTAASNLAFKHAMPELSSLIDDARTKAVEVFEARAVAERAASRARLEAKEQTLVRSAYDKERQMRVLLQRKAGTTTNKEMKEVSAVMAQVQRQIDSIERARTKIGDLLQRPAPLAAAQMHTLSEMSKGVYWLGRIRQATSFEDFMKTYFAHRRAIQSVAPETMSQVRSLIGHERNALVDSWNTPYGKTVLSLTTGKKGGAYWMPHDIVDDIKRWETSGGGALQPEAVGLARAWDAGTDFFKAGVTSLWPGFHGRNHLTNVANNFLAMGLQALSPVHATKMAMLLAGREGTVNTPYGPYTFDQVRRLAKRWGVVSEEALVFERSIGSSRVLDWAPFRAGRHVGRTIEEHAKFSNFVAALERGLSPEDAARRVHKFIFDYEEISPMHRSFLKRLIPFSIFTTKNIGLQVKSLVENPGRVLAIQKLGHSEGPDDSALPEYTRGEFKVRVHRQGKTWYITNLDAPFNGAMNKIFAGDFEQTGREWLGALSPLVAALPQAVTGQEWWSGRSLEEREALHGWNKYLAKTPVLRDYLEWNTQTNAAGKEEYTVNRTRMYLLFKSWAFSRLISEGERLAKMKDKPIGQAVVTILTGASWKEMDFQGEEEAKAKAALNRLNNALLRAGEAKEFTKIYYPKEK